METTGTVQWIKVCNITNESNIINKIIRIWLTRPKFDSVWHPKIAISIDTTPSPSVILSHLKAMIFHNYSLNIYSLFTMLHAGEVRKWWASWQRLLLYEWATLEVRATLLVGDFACKRTGTVKSGRVTQSAVSIILRILLFSFITLPKVDCER